MKKLVAILALSLLVMSCGGKKKTTDENVEEGVVDAVEQLDESVADAIMEEAGVPEIPVDALVYEGVFPTASGMGMKIVLAVFGDNFVRTSTYIKEDDTFVDHGKIEWSDDGNVLTLLGGDPESSFIVIEDQLYALDLEGKMMDGDLAEHYILKRVDNQTDAATPEKEATEEVVE